MLDPNSEDDLTGLDFVDVMGGELPPDPDDDENREEQV